MNRYLVFAGRRDNTVSGGGWDDFIATFEHRTEALACVAGRKSATVPGTSWWYQIVDTESGHVERLYET
jgi:hypothetical protein